MEDEGITESTNEKGQLVVDVNIFSDEWNRSNNGQYVFDRVRFKHRKIIFKYMGGMKETEKWQDIAREIAKKRKVSVKEVQKLLESEGLTEEEMKMFSDSTDKKIDVEKMYDLAPEFLQAFKVSSPTKLETLDDYEELDLSLCKTLFERCIKWAINGFSMNQERRKK